MSAPTTNQSEPGLSASKPQPSARRLIIGSEPLDELLARSKIFSDYVAALASEEEREIMGNIKKLVAKK